MSTSNALQSLNRRIDTLTESYEQTLQLVHRLARISFRPGSTPLEGEEGDARTELTNEIHESLKLAEEDLDLLKQEVDDLAADDSHGSHRRRESTREKDTDREKLRLKVQVARLVEDLKNARTQFRSAQLQAKRASDAAKRKERELLLQSYKEPSRAGTPLEPNGPSSTPPPQMQKRRRGGEKQTEEDILLNASGDVVAAMRRTQQLMQTEVQRSQLAQEIFDRSTADLQSLGEQYTDLDSMLKSSKGLVTQLLRSNKSDTWYLETAFYILIVIGAWLVYRRFLYGPLWWLVWLPLKLSYKIILGLFTAVGMGGGAVQSSSSLKVMPSASERPPSFPEGVRQPPHIQVGRGGPIQDTPKPSAEGTLSEKVGEMAEESRRPPEAHTRADGTVLKDSDEPRNPKKRVLDTDKEAEKQGSRIDEIVSDLEEGSEIPQEHVEQERARDEL